MIDAVRARAFGERRADQSGDGGEHVREADQVVGCRARLNMAGPTSEERHAGSTVPDIRLEAAVRPCRQVTLLFELRGR